MVREPRSLRAQTHTVSRFGVSLHLSGAACLGKMVLFSSYKNGAKEMRVVSHRSTSLTSSLAWSLSHWYSLIL